MSDDVAQRLQTRINQLSRENKPSELDLRQLQLDLWAYRDLAVAAEAAVSNLEWRLLQYDHHSKGLEKELSALRTKSARLEKLLRESQEEKTSIMRSWTFRLGRCVMSILWPIRKLSGIIRKESR
jgi:hypothetical protein